jgi:hypothetical protein
MKITILTKTKKLMRRVALLYNFLKILLMSGLIEYSRILILHLISICCHMLLLLKDMKKSGLMQIVGKEKTS